MHTNMHIGYLYDIYIEQIYIKQIKIQKNTSPFNKYLA